MKRKKPCPEFELGSQIQYSYAKRTSLVRKDVGLNNFFFVYEHRSIIIVKNPNINTMVIQ